MSNYYIGILSGTSLDAIDVVISKINSNEINIIATYSHSIPKDIKELCIKLAHNENTSIMEVGTLDTKLAYLFAEAINHSLKTNKISKDDIIAIGSHGQTIQHHPNNTYPFTMQLGDPNIIAEKTGITTIADFRRKDIAEGGQGAPLAPVLHQRLFKNNNKDVIVLNLGGIANISYLPNISNKQILGFDTGPANALMDYWIEKKLNKKFDSNGEWAKTGKVIPELLNIFLSDKYFSQDKPKSTGKEYFNAAWLENKIESIYKDKDIQATLLELTVITISKEIKSITNGADIIVCGGGAHNSHLLHKLKEEVNKQGNKYQIKSTDEYNTNITADWVEAVLFAYLAYLHKNKLYYNLNTITGNNKEKTLLGIEYR